MTDSHSAGSFLLLMRIIITPRTKTPHLIAMTSCCPWNYRRWTRWVTLSAEPHSGLSALAPRRVLRLCHSHALTTASCRRIIRHGIIIQAKVSEVTAAISCRCICRKNSSTEHSNWQYKLYIKSLPWVRMIPNRKPTQTAALSARLSPQRAFDMMRRVHERTNERTQRRTESHTVP